MEHRGYTGSVEYSEVDRVFHGRIDGIADIISYEGDTLEELEEDFREGVDSYLQHCEKDGVEPQRPYAGVLALRLSRETYFDMCGASRRAGSDLNGWIVEAIRMRLQSEAPVARGGAVDEISEAAGG